MLCCPMVSYGDGHMQKAGDSESSPFNSPAPHMLLGTGHIYRACKALRPCTGLLQLRLRYSATTKAVQGLAHDGTTCAQSQPSLENPSRNCTNNKVADPSHETPTLLFSFF